MTIKEIQEHEKWDKWILQNAQNGSFLQSWEWGQIVESEGAKVKRISIEKNERIICVAQIIINTTPLGWQYAFCPKGPIFSNNNSADDISNAFINLSKYLKKNEIIFLRFEPGKKITLPEKAQKTLDINPKATAILDLTEDLDVTMSRMKSKTRYNINLSERHGLSISHEKNLNDFLKLSAETAKRNNFRLHNPKHYRAILESNSSYQISATRDNSIIASNVFMRFNNTFTYLYGSSEYNSRNLMAPYLLQWEGIKLAKKLGCARYDFFGIAPLKRSAKIEKNQNDNDGEDYDLTHQYAGVTKFKLGFDGKRVENPGTFDFVFNKNKYLTYKLLRKLRRML
ncbi:MAG: peptidoglycan bridge formation glycyltransferase FemA/FemB family protein [bacterium]